MEDDRPLYVGRVISDPKVLAGKPVVKGTRISVEVVLDYLSHNPNLEELFADYPRLTMMDLQACLAYAHALLQNDECRMLPLQAIDAGQPQT